MTPEELADLHPRLFHVAGADAFSGISKLGLLPTAVLLKRFEVEPATQKELTEKRRPVPVVINHQRYGKVEINDNLPLTEKALAQCLDDGLAPRDWLSILNERVFFFPNEEAAFALASARMNVERVKTVVVLHTLPLARAYADSLELCPINSGSTIRKPARRGLATFTPLKKLSYAEWRGLRGQRDTIREVAIRGGIPDIKDFVVEAFEMQNGRRLRNLI